MIRLPAADTDCWFDEYWIVDSAPVECGRSRPTVKRPQRAGWAGYEYCAAYCERQRSAALDRVPQALWELITT
ncbi:hypothetical protein AR457_35305 [Streptomyces agglomeratus]|uniref:Uncharacterized protein n=1 Tax=Streptomyces agglomeratus TaxID=285458 RepID=A0A1E5PGP2_9ACTN|nr:hypothetical protein [Streptomyces agglomeratus]OEJ28689.1 hypothetical protein AS594_33695 [Streptomyces agglomeratus]OEJ37235.1 hypothetical protein BGK70_02795 [Streptomyces agglomeratus]OEJ48590.1 hypothetical protein AR457_35305 [Streptomyces agglomeratus]OEJ49790.1 hypothetical protein BGK72_02365 [Streptomyces agglomeratus]OEJ57096.1 hypothetical protein BGM19_02905 [Streptomyces agglomeratus]